MACVHPQNRLAYSRLPAGNIPFKHAGWALLMREQELAQTKITAVC